MDHLHNIIANTPGHVRPGNQVDAHSFLLARNLEMQALLSEISKLDPYDYYCVHIIIPARCSPGQNRMLVYIYIQIVFLVFFFGIFCSFRKPKSISFLYIIDMVSNRYDIKAVRGCFFA